MKTCKAMHILVLLFAFNSLYSVGDMEPRAADRMTISWKKPIKKPKQCVLMEKKIGIERII